ncbi:hypothetical protein IWX49DRAFT_551858 [Phyllosticta citricarpa]
MLAAHSEGSLDEAEAALTTESRTSHNKSDRSSTKSFGMLPRKSFFDWFSDIPFHRHILDTLRFDDDRDASCPWTFGFLAVPLAIFALFQRAASELQRTASVATVLAFHFWISGFQDFSHFCTINSGAFYSATSIRFLHSALQFDDTYTPLAGWGSVRDKSSLRRPCTRTSSVHSCRKERQAWHIDPVEAARRAVSSSRSEQEEREAQL